MRRRHPAQNPQTQHLNLFPPRNRLLLNAQKWLDIKETETAGMGGGGGGMGGLGDVVRRPLAAERVSRSS